MTPPKREKQKKPTHFSKNRTDLNRLRSRIDKIDKLILKNLEKRFELVQDIYKVKVKHNFYFKDVKREREILSRLEDRYCRQTSKTELVKGEFHQFYYPIFKEILKQSLRALRRQNK